MKNVSFVLTGLACQSDAPVSSTATPAESTSSESATAPTPAPDIAASPAINPASNPASKTVDLSAVSAPTSAPAPQTKVVTTAPGMNPPHGQPGHRCEIAVGAPLDSKPAAKGATAATTAPLRSTTVTVPPPTSGTVAPTATAPPTAVAPGMNPAHGQPGHRCDIAVGAPLDSKPAAKQ